MNDKKLLIAGIDPGITTACAILGIEGNLIHLNSSKNMALSLLISESINFGKVVLVGTDKAKAPSLVDSFATKFGAKIIKPDEDLKVTDKKAMVKGFEFEDEHQSDALASALFAYKNAKPLLDRIDNFVEENKKPHLRNKIKELVMLNGISIKSAVSILEKKDEESKIIEKVIEKKVLNENDFLRVYDKMKKYEEEIKLLKSYNVNLKNRVSNLENPKIKNVNPTSTQKTKDFRESRIRFLENLAKLKERERWNLKSIIGKLNKIISGIDDYYILKKLDTLGLNEFESKNKILGIRKNDILLVDNPSIFSEESINLLRDKVFVIISKNPPGKKLQNELPFIFLNSSNLSIEEDRYFGFVEKKQFEMEKNKIDWARKIIEDYRREKSISR